MNNKISNPFLKKLISEIAVNANKGRLDLNWEVIEEAKKKKSVKEAEEPKKDEPSADAGGDLPPLGGADETPKDAQAKEPKKDAAPEANPADAVSKEVPTDAASEEDADQAKADAAKAKAELAKTQAEKAQAEKEIKNQSYISIGSSSGTQFLLGKVLDQAFKTNTIDDLAKNMVDTLKIKTPDAMDSFSQDVVTYMAMPGMPELVSTMKTLANKNPEKPEETPAA